MPNGIRQRINKYKTLQALQIINPLKFMFSEDHTIKKLVVIPSSVAGGIGS